MNISNKPMIIGLSGTFASGKDTLAHYLAKDHNFFHVSTGDIVRQEAMKRRGSVERPVLYEVGYELRREYGGGVTVELAIKLFEEKCANHQGNYDGLVISGIRTLGELKVLKASGGKMVFVDAPIEVRYERMTSRRRDSEAELTLDEFKEKEAREITPSREGEEEEFNLGAIKKMADVKLSNGIDLESFFEEAKQKIGF